jgi:type IV secretory pathway VirB10-like protein
MNLIRAFLTGATVCLVSLSALAQWQWLDKDGRKVFSDRPPPADIPIKNILKQPGGKLKAVETAPDEAAAGPAGAPATPKVAASGLRVSGKDKELETKKKQAEDAEAAKRKAEEDKNAQAKADNCNRARQGKATYDSGARVARVNASGEREVMDDAARAAETKRMQDMIDSNCK